MAKLLVYRPLRGYGVAVQAYLALAVLANAFAAYYVAQERYIYYWDWSHYWLWYRDLTTSLAQQPMVTLSALIDSVRQDDYNRLPVLPLVPWGWLFGTNRLSYILAITNVYLLPAVFVMGLLVQRLFRPYCSRRPFLPFVLTAASLLMLHTLWAGVLRGFPDVAGVVLIGGILLLHFARPLAEQGLGRLVATGLLLCLLVLLRRWYAYWVVAFFPALIVAHGLDIHQRHEIAWRHYLTTSRNAIIIGLTFTVALLGLATPFALRAIHTDYSDTFSAYRSTSSLLDATRLLPGLFGLGEVVPGLAGLVWLTVRKDTRVMGSFLLVQFSTIFVLFTRTQDFGLQHYYLIIPSIATGIAAAVIGLWERMMTGLWRTLSVGSVFAALVVTSITSFAPGAVAITERLGNLVPSRRIHPLVRNDIDALERLLVRVEALEREQPGDVYVLASSEVLNSNILYNACKYRPRPRSFCDRILSTSDVDKRDGFPRQILHATYVVAATPTQYHLRPDDQRIVGVLSRSVIEGHGIGASFRRLPGEFTLDHGVSAWIYTKVRPFRRSDLNTLEGEFKGYYPGKQHLFSVP
jgi:hypothetical protein